MSAAAYLKTAGRPTERAVHGEVLRWLRANVSDLVFHPRNEAGAGRDARWGAREKALGVMSGVADLIGIVEFGPLAGRLFAVEVKRLGFKASDVLPNQVAFGHGVMDRGGLFCVAGSVEEVEIWARVQGIVRPRGWVAPWKREGEGW